MLRIADHWHGSDLGLQRQGNEDNYFVHAPLFVVADGMGGAQAGEVASEMAVESFNDGIPDGDSPAEGLKHIIEEANRRIHERSRSDNQRAGMGTTVTAAHVGEDSVTIAHVGDSRCYLVRDGDLIRLTKDHSLVGELVERGKLTEEAGRAASAALGHHPRARARAERAGRRRRVPGEGRRPVHGVLGRPDVDGPRAEAQAAAGRQRRARSTSSAAS